MKALLKRLDVIERNGSAAVYCIRRYSGQSEEQAVSAYEAANGAMGEGGSALCVIINKPFVDPMGVQ